MFEQRNVFCDKCRKFILSPIQEFKIEKWTICYDCSEKVINRCHTCRRPIFKSDLIYQFSLSWGAEYFVNANDTKNIIQCDWCYQKNLLKQEKEKKLWRWKLVRLLLGVYIVALLTCILILFYPDLEKKFNDAPEFVRYLLLFLLLVAPFVIFWMVSRIGSGYEVNKDNGLKKARVRK